MLDFFTLRLRLSFLLKYHQTHDQEKDDHHHTHHHHDYQRTTSGVPSEKAIIPVEVEVEDCVRLSPVSQAVE